MDSVEFPWTMFSGCSKGMVRMLEGVHAHLKGATSVYVLECGGRCKIGIARCVPARISNIQMNCPLPITVALQRLFDSREEARTVERDMHTMFSAARLWGEWFDVPPEHAARALRDHPGAVPAVAMVATELPAVDIWPKRNNPKPRKEPPKSRFDGMTPSEIADALREASKSLNW